MARSLEQIAARNCVRVLGEGERPLVLAHGYGCDQNMWRRLLPMVERDYRVILFDLTGCGRSDLRAYDRAKYGTLAGYAEDLVEILVAFARRPAFVVGHSVSAMIGLLAGIARPELFEAQVMVCPSPCYVNDDDYRGGFTRADIEGLLDTLDHNYLGWVSTMAPVIMGAPDRPELGRELANSFCATDPEIAKHFASVAFLSDHRADVPRLRVRSLVLQCSEDSLAPLEVGTFMHNKLPHSELKVIHNIGHCPHLSATADVGHAMREFL